MPNYLSLPHAKQTRSHDARVDLANRQLICQVLSNSPACLSSPEIWRVHCAEKNIDTDLVWVPDQYYSHSIPGISTYTGSIPGKHDLGTLPGQYQEFVVYRWYKPEFVIQTWCESHIRPKSSILAKDARFVIVGSNASP